MTSIWNFSTRAAVILIFSAFTFFGCSTRAPEKNQTPINAVQWQSVTFGLCEDYPEESRNLAQARRDLLLLKTNQVSTLRIAFGWDAIEPSKGVYDWSFWDEFVAMADELGIRLIPYVCYTPQWAARDSTNQFWTQPPKNYGDFSDFLTQLARRYGSKIDSWEIWNEPDNTAYWSGSAADFAELLRVGSRAVRAADPGAKIVSGGLAWNLNFLREFCSEPGVGPALDVVNLHNYFETWAEEGVEYVDDYVFRANRILENSKVNAALWMAEIGYSSFRTNGVISEAYHATYIYEHTPEFQAATVFRMLTPLLFPKRISLVAWYRIHDLPAGQEVIGDVNNRHLGVVDERGEPKPALRAMIFFTRLFRNGFRSANNAIRLTSDLQSDVESYAFETTDGLVVITWMKVVSPQTPFSTSGKISDPRREKIRLRLPRQFSSHGVLCNALGETVTEISSKDGAVVFDLGGGDVRILIVRPAGN